MPNPPSQPGIYVQELPTGPRSIAAVGTSVAAFVGGARRGPLDTPVRVFGLADFERTFGGHWPQFPMSQAVRQFFLNGGGEAVVVRVARRSGPEAARQAVIDLGDGTHLEASTPGSWGNQLAVAVATGDDPDAFDLSVLELADGEPPPGTPAAFTVREQFIAMSMRPDSPRFVAKVLSESSMLVRVAALGTTRPSATNGSPRAALPGSGSDGGPIGAAEVSDEANRAVKTGIYALPEPGGFNLLCIPPFTPDTHDNGLATWAAASALCRERRAMLLVDAPADWKVADAERGIAAYAGLARENAAIYFPWLQVMDPSKAGASLRSAPCGAVAGVICRSDAQRGVWKAPAGTDATLVGATGLLVGGRPLGLNDTDIGRLNPLGINCLRLMPPGAPAVWGARTLAGGDGQASEWKYLPVRRLALFIEASLAQGTAWAVFEPNDEPLWAQLRLAVGNFMQALFREGAFQGATPGEAYFVRCDPSTTTAADIQAGRVNLVVGFAPTRPGEFVVLRVQVAAGVPGPP